MHNVPAVIAFNVLLGVALILVIAIAAMANRPVGTYPNSVCLAPTLIILVTLFPHSLIGALLARQLSL
jgi:hypothetical protein